MEQEIAGINFKIAEAEKTGNPEGLSSVLSDHLVFRRANGTTTDKAGYLASIKPGRFEYLFYHQEEIGIAKNGNEAYCTLIVKGGIAGDEMETGANAAVKHGIWHNTRIFHKEDGQWRLYKWFNVTLSDLQDQTLGQNPDERQKQVSAFLQKDYELKVNYLKDHFSRMWTRFNFFLTLETTLLGGKVYFMDTLKMVSKTDGQLSQELTSAPESFALAVAGIMISLLWFFMSAQDSFLGRVYRAQAQEAGIACRQWLVTHHSLSNIGDTTHSEVSAQLLSWRWEWVSSTKLPALIALIAVLLWAWSACF